MMATPPAGKTSIEAIPVDGMDEVYRIEFIWNGKTRVIYFIGNENGEELSSYLGYLQEIAKRENLNREGSCIIDLFI